jgi:hypothetical protein
VFSYSVKSVGVMVANAVSSAARMDGWLTFSPHALP